MKIKSTLRLYTYAVTERHDPTALLQVYCDMLVNKLKTVVPNVKQDFHSEISPLSVLPRETGNRAQAYCITFTLVEDTIWWKFKRALKLKKFLFIADTHLIEETALLTIEQLLKTLKFKKKTKLTSSTDSSLCTTIYETLWI